MRRVIIAVVLLCLIVKASAQDAGVEKSVWGVQLGIYPISLYNEYRLTNSLALRSEIGFSYGWSGGGGIDASNYWAIIPNINLEPRFYYNFKRRNRLNKRIDGNSGNYLSVNVGYTAGGFAIAKNTEVYSSFNLIPTYGLRRNIGKKFNFEFAFGVGHSWTFKKFDYVNFITREIETYDETVSEVAYGLRLSIGYIF
ncbi:hypothetical protein ACT3CD_03300 [Geofilum sp. OHC36d9]|uniref:hypothetical protein n=1 Tax=Geofilum sp. OHC36d9 TaxID=3458413 RepID=UPI004034103D